MKARQVVLGVMLLSVSRSSVATSADLLHVKFVGVAGFLISYGDDVIMTAPLYSNPKPIVLDSNLEVSGYFFAPMHPDSGRIHQFNPASPVPSAILVGQGHYDHLMDVPEVWSIAAAKGKAPLVYGSSTVSRILAGYLPPPGQFAPLGVAIPRDHIIVLDDDVDTRKCGSERWTNDVSQCGLAAGRTGAWVAVPGTRIRVRALCGQHPPQALQAIHFWPGCLLRDRLSPPETISDYPEGPIFAYLIDFVDSAGIPVFRLYFQDAPSNGPLGEVPEDLVAERPIDVGLLCAGNFDATEQPEEIVTNARMKHAILGHWENFFRPQNLAAQPIPGLNVAKYQRLIRTRLQGLGRSCQAHRPNPQEEYLFDLEGKAVTANGAPLPQQ